MQLRTSKGNYEIWEIIEGKLEELRGFIFVKGKFGNKEIKILIDTGSVASLVNKVWKIIMD